MDIADNPHPSPWMLRVDADTYHPPKIGVWPKAAIERAQCQARLNTVEREQARASLMPTSTSIVYLSGGSSPPFTPRCSQWYRLSFFPDTHKKSPIPQHRAPISHKKITYNHFTYLRLMFEACFRHAFKSASSSGFSTPRFCIDDPIAIRSSSV